MAKTVRRAVPQMVQTYPGDVIELSATVEITGQGGRKTWAKVGLATTQQPDEGTDDVVERTEKFVFESLENLQEGLK